ncbi:MAG: AMP-binding protein [Deltaproteobacteria bacterium]
MKGKSKNINQYLLDAMGEFRDVACLKVKRGGRYQDLLYRDFKDGVFRIADFLQSGRGLTSGERVAIIAENSPEWMMTCVACLMSGLVVVPLNPHLPKEVIQYSLGHSGASAVLVGGQEQIPALREAALGNLKLVLTVDGDAEGAATLDNFSIVAICAICAAAPVSKKRESSLRAAAESVSPDSPSFIVYAVKETGKIRGVVFNHRQSFLSLRHIAEWFILGGGDLAFTLVNWSYITSLVATFHYFVCGTANALAESLDKSFDNLQEVSPTVVMSIPYGFDYIHGRVMSEVAKLPESRRKMFQWALATGKEFRAAGLGADEPLRERFSRADMTFFHPIRSMLGGRLSRIYAGGAPLPQDLFEFADSIGLVPLNVYGTIESGGFPAVSHPAATRLGSCGQVASGFQIRIADDGEVLVRGETVTQSYWAEPEDIRQVLDSDRWLHTGDLGRFDSDGFLYIIGHKHSLIILSRGNKIIPSKIENALASEPLISQAMVFGEGMPYISALIAPDLAAAGAALEANPGIAAGSEDTPVIGINHPALKALVDGAVAAVNAKLSLWERVEAYTLVETLYDEYGEINPSQKMSRQALALRYVAEINSMYPNIPHIEERAATQVHLPPEQLRELLEKQDILDAWMKDAGIEFLFDLARSKQIDAPSMVHICETVASIAQMQSEEKPLSTAIIVGDPAQIARVLPVSEIELQRYDHIRRMQHVVINLAKMVDGLVLGYGVDKHGFVRRVHKLEVPLREHESFILSPQFRRHAAISRECNAVVFFVPPGGRQARVFADGLMVGRYSNGNWSSESIPRVDETVAQLAVDKRYDLNAIQRVFRCAFRMSEANLGAIFLLGSAEAILERSDPPEINAFAAIINADLKRLSDGEIINFAKQDGATVIDIESGRLASCMVLLRPRADTTAEIGLGKGSRHSSAAKTSAETKCLAITVSQDGPITVYDCGKRILSL